MGTGWDRRLRSPAFWWSLRRRRRAHEDHAGQHGPGASPATLGEVHFPVTCSPKAQVRFDRAMTLQHSFRYQQASEAFRSVHAADPSCTMAL